MKNDSQKDLFQTEVGKKICKLLKLETVDYKELGRQVIEIVEEEKPVEGWAETRPKTRIHFWSDNKSAYVLTNNVARAVEAMKEEYPYYAKATNQTKELLLTDTELYF